MKEVDVMGQAYVVDTAVMTCSLGTAPADLTVLPSRTVMLRGKHRANIGDCVPFVNVPTFGSCMVTVPPKVCVPACSIWMGGKADVLVQGMPALLDDSFATCPAGGGVITIADCGQ